MAEYLCGTCQTEVGDSVNLILCDLCDKWHCTICVDLTNANYEKLKVNRNPWFCPMCAEEIPFFALANKDLKNLLSNSFLKKLFFKRVHQKQKFI